MAKDATMDILFGLQKTAETKIFDFLTPQLYNIEDMDSKDCVISLAFSGCYVFKSTREIDPARSGMFYIDGSPTEKPVLVVDAMFGQLVGVCVRKYLHRYDATYRIRYTGAFDIAGRETLVQGSSLYSQWNPDKIQVHLFTERRRYEIRTADK